MRGVMTDAEILARIQQLVSEEYRIRNEGADAAAIEEYDDIEERLDQCWDLLRRRRASRDAGAAPDAETPRDSATVESYQQ